MNQQVVVERAARRTAAAERRAAAHAAAAHGAGGRPGPDHGSSGRTPGPVGPRALPEARSARPREWRTLAAVSVGVLVVLLVATWSVAQGWGRGPVVGPGELALGDGVVRVDGVVSAAAPQHAMPGMGTDEDPVAEGHRRISVDVTLMAGAEPMRYAAEGFRLEVDGEDAARSAHRDVLPGDVLPAGTRLSGTILFDVPVQATAGTLVYDGAGSTEIVLPLEDEPATGGATVEDPAGHGDEHGDEHAGDPAGDPATGEALTEPGA